MKCMKCGEDRIRSDGHICIKNTGVIAEESVYRYPEKREPPDVNESLDNIADVLRDILEELKKMNELTEGK